MFAVAIDGVLVGALWGGIIGAIVGVIVWAVKKLASAGKHDAEV